MKIKRWIAMNAFNEPNVFTILKVYITEDQTILCEKRKGLNNNRNIFPKRLTLSTLLFNFIVIFTPAKVWQHLDVAMLVFSKTHVFLISFYEIKAEKVNQPQNLGYCDTEIVMLDCYHYNFIYG